jgi:hypothetical protein
MFFLKELEMVSPEDSMVIITKLKAMMKNMFSPASGVTNIIKQPGGIKERPPMTRPYAPPKKAIRPMDLTHIWIV